MIKIKMNKNQLGCWRTRTTIYNRFKKKDIYIIEYQTKRKLDKEGIMIYDNR